MPTPVYGMISDEIAKKYPGMQVEQIITSIVEEKEQVIQEKENLKKQMEYSKGEGIRSRFRVTEEGCKLWIEKRASARGAWLERMFEASNEYRTFIAWYTKKAQEQFNDFDPNEKELAPLGKPHEKVKAPANSEELLNGTGVQTKDLDSFLEDRKEETK